MHLFANIIGKKWNVTPLIRQEVVFSLQHFSAPALDLMPYLQARRTRDCKKGIKGLIKEKRERGSTNYNLVITNLVSAFDK